MFWSSKDSCIISWLFPNKHNKFSGSQKILGERNPPPQKKNTKKNQFFDNVEEPFAQGSKKVEILKSFICYFSRCSLQPASCIKMVDWAVENNYVQDHVLFFPSILPFAKQRQFITLLCCSLAFLVVMKTLSQVGLLLIFELRTEIWNWYWDRLALYKY